MKLKRVMIAAPKSGSGKTTITCALLHALKKKGYPAVSYKCGPDYIDPMFHRQILHVPSKNLDTFFTGKQETGRLFIQQRTEEDFAVLEGVMGLYDGLGGIRQEGSSYHLAQVTKTPIILVVDAKGMGRSVIALLAGFLAWDCEHLIQGVIFNRMSASSYETIRQLTEQELPIRVLGYFPNQPDFCLESRHLGLKMPHELADLEQKIQAASGVFTQTVSLEKIVEIAEAAPEVLPEEPEQEKQGTAVPECALDGPVIAVARDEAFCFYYEDNLRLLEKYGAKLAYFSPLHDESLPANCCAILLGGGYPELYVRQLADNLSMKAAIRDAFDRKMPLVAECGGFMYLHRAIVDEMGMLWPMAGVIDGVCENIKKLVRFGYVEVEEKKSSFLPPKQRIRGHEFHYYDSTENGTGCQAYKPVSGKSYPCVHVGEHYWLGFAHLYYPSNPAFAERFVKKAIQYSKKNQ